MPDTSTLTEDPRIRLKRYRSRLCTHHCPGAIKQPHANAKDAATPLPTPIFSTPFPISNFFHSPNRHSNFYIPNPHVTHKSTHQEGRKEGAQADCQRSNEALCRRCKYWHRSYQLSNVTQRTMARTSHPPSPASLSLGSTRRLHEPLSAVYGRAEWISNLFRLHTLHGRLRGRCHTQLRAK